MPGNGSCDFSYSGLDTGTGNDEHFNYKASWTFKWSLGLRSFAWLEWIQASLTCWGGSTFDLYLIQAGRFEVAYDSTRGSAYKFVDIHVNLNMFLDARVQLSK